MQSFIQKSKIHQVIGKPIWPSEYRDYKTFDFDAKTQFLGMTFEPNIEINDFSLLNSDRIYHDE